MLQKYYLLNGGLAGTLNSHITKLALGKHGYSEKTQQEVTMRQFPEDDEELNRLLAQKTQEFEDSKTTH